MTLPPPTTWRWATKAETDEGAATPSTGGRKPLSRAEAARHASLVRWGKESPFAARLKEIQQRGKKPKGKAGGKPKPSDEDKAKEREARRAERAAEREQMRKERAEERATIRAEKDKAKAEGATPPPTEKEKPKKGGGGGGGGGSAKPSEEERAKAEAEKAKAKEAERLRLKAEREADRAKRDAETEARIAAREARRSKARAEEEARRKAEAAAAEREEVDALMTDWEAGRVGLSYKDQRRAVRLGLAKWDDAGNIRRVPPATKAAESYTPPQAVQRAARAALERRAKQAPSRRGGTAVGIARARNLANGDALPLATVRRMYSFFQRHDKTRPETPDPNSPWAQAWGLWGGDAGWRWARGIVERAETKAADALALELDLLELSDV